MKPSEQIRTAIENSGMSRYAIAKLTGITQATLSRFVARKIHLSTETLDLLAPALGIQIVVKLPAKRKGARRG